MFPIPPSHPTHLTTKTHTRGSHVVLMESPSDGDTAVSMIRPMLTRASAYVDEPRRCLRHTECRTSSSPKSCKKCKKIGNIRAAIDTTGEPRAAFALNSHGPETRQDSEDVRYRLPQGSLRTSGGAPPHTDPHTTPRGISPSKTRCRLSSPNPRPVHPVPSRAPHRTATCSWTPSSPSGTLG